MSDAPEEPLGLESVAEPAVPPPTAPDERTQEQRQAELAEILLVREMASKAAFRSVFISERENKRLKQELEASEKDRRELQRKVFGLGPQNALLTQSIHDMRGTFAIAALLMTGGGTSVSVAGAISDATWKPISLIAGISAFVIGFVLTLYTLIWVKPIHTEEEENSAP